MTIEDFDLEDVYDDEIAPLMAQILEICRKHKIPMMASFCYSNNNEEDDKGLCTSTLNNFDDRYIENYEHAVRYLIEGPPTAATLITVMSDTLKPPRYI
jgi:hypothetical protein